MSPVLLPIRWLMIPQPDKLPRELEGGETPSFSFLLPELKLECAVDYEDRRANLMINCLRDLPRLEAVPEHDGILAIAAYGPSLKHGMHVLYREVLAGHGVMTVSGAHDLLISNGIVPDWHAELDPRERKAAFVANPRDDIKYLIASVCHPRVFENLKRCNVTMWHLGDGEEAIADIKRLEGSALIHPSAQAIGLNAIVLGHTLGYRRFSLHGFDCCYLEGTAHPGFHNGRNNDANRLEVRCGERIFETRPEWVQYARNFMDTMLPKMPGCDFTIHGPGLLAEMVRQGLKEAA